MMRVFFTGAFRKPRELNWLIGAQLSMLALVEGFAGYSLLTTCSPARGCGPPKASCVPSRSWAATSPTSCSAARSRARRSSPPVLRARAAAPGDLVGLFTGAHRPRGPASTPSSPGPAAPTNVVGYPVMPVYAAKAARFFFIVFGVVALMSALVTINPIWAYGPYDPSPVTAGSQPDWYMGFADGALRLLRASWSSRRSGSRSASTS